MKKRLIPIIIALCFLVGGCSKQSVSSPVSESISVYRVLRPEYQTDGKLIQSEKSALPIDADPVLLAISAVSGTPDSDRLLSPLPKGVRITDAVLEENCVTVYMNSQYINLVGIEKTITDACITLTLCSIQGVDFVAICVGDEVIENKLSTEDFLLFDNIISSQKAQIRLYFPKSSENTLGSEYHTISFDDDNSAERSILDALFKGPVSDKLKRAFPLGTIVLSVYTQDGVCSVSLSGISVEDESLLPEEAELAVYSIVNSLTSLASVNSVQILIDGKQVQTLWGFDISGLLNRNGSIIGSAFTE